MTFLSIGDLGFIWLLLSTALSVSANTPSISIPRAGNNSSNMIDFYKETRWSKKKNAFVTADTEEIYKKMQDRMDGLEPEHRTDEVAATVFREVLGHKPGYERGLGEMVIPESSRLRDQLKMKQYLAEIERQKQEADQQRRDAEQYKIQLEEMRTEMRDLKEQQMQTNNMLQTFFKGLPGFTGSFQQTQGCSNSP